MPKEAVTSTTTTKEIESMAHILWSGHYGYECPNCRFNVYGKGEDWCQSHLLEHLVDLLRSTPEEAELGTVQTTKVVLEKPPISLEDFKIEMDRLQGCCLKHPEDYQVDQIVHVEYWVESIPDEATGYAIFRLKDGRWGSMDESQDYTGHGCQCGSNVSFHPTKEDAIRLGIGEDGCRILGIEMPV